MGLGSETRPGWVSKFAWTTDVTSEDRAWEHYFVSLHWVFCVFTPAGMSVQPANVRERIFTVGLLVLSLITYPCLVGSVTNNMGKLSGANSADWQRMWVLRRFLKQNHVSKSLCIRILKYVEHVYWQRNCTIDSRNVQGLEVITQPLRLRLNSEIFAPRLKYHPLFYRMTVRHRSFLEEICSSISVAHLTVGDVLFRYGDASRSCYILNSGSVEYTIGKGSAAIDPPVQIREWVAEGCLWVNWQILGRCEACAESTIICLEAAPFIRRAREHYYVWLICSSYATIFATHVNNPHTDPSDVIRDTSLDKEFQKNSFQGFNRRSLPRSSLRDTNRSNRSSTRSR